MAHILIANDKGGVGKSTVAQYCGARMRRAQKAVRIVDIDRQPKLHRFFGERAVISLPFESGSPEWSAMIPWLESDTPLVLDLGPQAWTEFASWLGMKRTTALSREPAVTILVPVTADIEAVLTASRTITHARALLPQAMIVILECDKDGAVDALAGLPAADALRQAVAATRSLSIRIPVLGQDEYALLAAHGLSFDRIEAIDESRTADVALIVTGDPARAAAAVKATKQWIGEMNEAFRALSARSAAPRTAEFPRVAAPAPAVPTRRVIKVRPEPAVRWPQAIAAAPWNNGGIPTPQQFDETHYLAQNPDVRQAVAAGEIADGYTHYRDHGHRENRSYRIRSTG